MELIDIRQLRTFQLLARAGSFTEVARQMFVTQSAVSHSMKALETSLDLQLLDRRGKTIALTAEGEVLLRRADRIMVEMSGAFKDLKSVSQWGYGRLRVGCTDTSCQYLLPAVLREFRESFPHCEVSIQSADTHELLGMLTQGEVDLAIGIHASSEEPSFQFRPMFTDRLIFAVSPLHPWASGGGLSEASIGSETFIIYARKSPTYQLVDKYFRRAGLHAPKVTELGNMEAIKELAKIGMGVGIITPWVIANELREGTLVAVEPPGGKPLTRRWGAFSRNSSQGFPLSTETFLGICGTVSRNLEGADAASRFPIAG